MILVTGGAGYIGSHYVLFERDRGNEVVVLDDLVLGHREAVRDTPLVVGSTYDRAVLDRVFSEYAIDAVVHFAARAAVGESVSHPDRYLQHNVVGTFTLLEAMRAHGVPHLVFSSTCATYGDPVYIPMDELHRQAPINPYGESKLFCERMMAAYDRAYGIRHTALRYFNAAGADPDGRIGESHDPETHLVPLVLQVASGSRSHITVFGSDYDTPDGTCVRDYIHILDLATAHGLALDRLRSGGASAVFNLGTGTGNSVREVIRTCEEITQRPIKTIEGDRRPGDPPRLVASSARAEAELGWTPRWQRLAEIVCTAWHWEQTRTY